MNQINIVLHDGTQLIFKEDELPYTIETVLDDFCSGNEYLEIEKDYGRKLILNKDYIVAINVEEAEE